jgi:hypothetical protein
MAFLLKIKDFMIRENEREKTRIEKRKKERAAMTPSQKRSEIYLWALLVAILIVGYIGSFIISAFALTLFINSFAWNVIQNKPVRKRAIAWGLAIGMGPIFVLGIATGIKSVDFIKGNSYKTALIENIQKDIQIFTDDFNKGEVMVEVLDSIEVDMKNQNDIPAKFIFEVSQKMGIFGRVDYDDVNAALPIKDLFFGGKGVMFLSYDVVHHHQAIRKEILEKHYGKPFEELSFQEITELPDIKNIYKGIPLLSCILDTNGKATSVVGSPAAHAMDLRNIDTTGNLVEICELFNGTKTPPKTLDWSDESFEKASK